MSLLRLLKTGRSLEGAEESVNRYRVTNQKLLPRFGVANPFPIAAGGQGKPQGHEIDAKQSSAKCFRGWGTQAGTVRGEVARQKGVGCRFGRMADGEPESQTLAGPSANGVPARQQTGPGAG